MREGGNSQQLALVVSCIGRRLLMGQHIIDEVEAAGVELGAKVARLGFYSYGEIAAQRLRRCASCTTRR